MNSSMHTTKTVQLTPNHYSRRSKPVNLSVLDEKLFEHEYVKEIRGTQLILSINTQLLGKYYLSSYRNRNEFIKHIIKQRLGTSEKIKDLLGYLHSNLKPSISFDIGIKLTGHWLHDYFHWLTEGLTKVVCLSHLGFNGTIILPDSFGSVRYIRESLDYFHLQYSFIPNNTQVNVGSLYKIEFEFDPGNYDSTLLSLFYSILSAQSFDSTLTKRIYISRLNAKKRKIINENELYGILKKHCIDIVNPENLSFQDQVTLFRNAKTIIGLHGAGLTNMLFMNRFSNVVEIRKKEDSLSNCFFTLSSDLNHNYYYLLAEPVNGDLHEGDCIVKPELLDYFLSAHSV